jgi:hypothetical protein
MRAVFEVKKVDWEAVYYLLFTVIIMYVVFTD